MMKALVVDDDANIARLVTSQLERHGFQVTVAHNGLQALEHTRQEHPSLIVLDVEMPVMDGLECLRKLRKNPETAAIPVIMLTGNDTPADVVAGWETGANLYLSKPFHPAKLRAAIEHIFSTAEDKPVPV